MARTKKRKLTEAEWREVFRIRCRSKQGLPNSVADQALVDAAFAENQKRYGAMDADVFDATVPYGSVKRWKR